MQPETTTHEATVVVAVGNLVRVAITFAQAPRRWQRPDHVSLPAATGMAGAMDSLLISCR
jgi:hypothetical protein